MTIQPDIEQMQSLQREKYSVFLQKTEIFFVAFLIGFLSFKALRSINDIVFALLVTIFITNTVISYRKTRSLPSFTHKPLDVFILLSFLWALLTLFQALDPSYSFAEIMHKMTKQYLLYFLTFYIVSDYIDNKGEMKNIFILLVVATCIMSLYAIYQFLQSPVILKTRVTGFTQAFYRLSVFLVLSIPIMVVLFISQKGWMKKMFFFIMLASCIALVFTFTRAAWIAVIIEVIVLVSFLSRKYLRKISIALVVLLLIGSIIAVSSGDYRKLIIHGSEQPRIAAFQYSIDIIKNNFFMGIGYGKKSFLLNFQNNVEVQHAHNIFLNTAIETGMPGLALFVVILFLIIRIFLSALKANPPYEKRMFIAGIFAAIIGFLTLNLFDYMYIGWPGQMFWMMVGTGHAFIKSGLSG